MSDWQPFSAMAVPQVFREAVLCRHLLGLKTTHKMPKYQEVIVEPYWIADVAVHRPDPRGSTFIHLDPPLPGLWCGIRKGSESCDFGDNIEYLLTEIREWKILTAEDMTSRRIPQKAYREFEGHPAKSALLSWDMALRRAWSEAVSKPDFDPTLWVAKDKRLGEIANEVLTWYPEFLK